MLFAPLLYSQGVVHNILWCIVTYPGLSEPEAIAQRAEAKLGVWDTAVVPLSSIDGQRKVDALCIAVKGEVSGYIVG